MEPDEHRPIVRSRRSPQNGSTAVELREASQPLLQNQKALCLVGIVAAVIAAVADLVLQLTGDTSHLGSKVYAYLLDVSHDRLLFGHFVGITAILVEILGFWGVALGINRRSPRLWFVGISSVAYAVGAAFHAMFASIGLALQFAAKSGASSDFLAGLATAIWPAHHGLGAVTLAGIVLQSLLFSSSVALGRSTYPRWLAVCSPLPIIVLFALVTHVVPSTRLVLLPAGINIANGLFFALAALKCAYSDNSIIGGTISIQ